MRPLLFLFVAGCFQAEANPMAVARLNPDALLSAEAYTELLFDGAQGTTRAVRVARDQVEGLDALEEKEAREAADLAIGSCPYNRSGVQLPIALSLALQRHDAGTVEPEIRAEWRRLQVGLAEHVALLDQFGVTNLRAPLDGEYLYSHPDVIVTRSQLEAAADPIAVTQHLVDAIPRLVDGYDAETVRFLESAQLTLGGHTRDQWPYVAILDAWRADLKAIEPRISDEALQAEVRAMIEVLNAFSSSRC